ncbi:uncharacterized protein LOC142786315 [Rhipicephalus microplus]|uniref:uncharacterized protein LOC142786315 n=1 Tax=Rhipicephalus microplus TaxID=6941 RepID=UPI003F6C09A8
MLLMLSGDIESNPGPMSKIESEAFAAAMLTIQKLEEGHAALSAQLSETIEKLTLALESSVASRSATGTGTPNNSLHQISDHLTEITSRCNDTENRQRRSNLLFFGIEDDPKEGWAASEKRIIEFCSEKFNISLTGAQFERVHRLGKFRDSKQRPIIAKLTFFKDKQQILASAPKLKGSKYSIGEDFSLATRQARKSLIEFAKTQRKPFKLSVDRLRMDGKTYILVHRS